MINNGLDITSSERMIQMNHLVRFMNELNWFIEENQLKRMIHHKSDITL